MTIRPSPSLCSLVAVACWLSAGVANGSTAQTSNKAPPNTRPAASPAESSPQPIDKPTGPTADVVEPATLPVPRTITPSTAPSRSAPAGPPAPGLVRRNDGGYDYVDPHGQFTARFYPDGTMAFADPWRRVTKNDRDNGRCCALPPAGLGSLNPFMGVSMSGPVEWLLAIQGKDPLVNAKTELLARTRAVRTTLAIEWARKQIKKRFDELDNDLLAMWNRQDRSPEQRRAQLFHTWDDCDEVFNVRPGNVPPEAVSTIDAERLQTANAARAKIIRFIRHHLAAGSTTAYPPSEITKLNAQRTSKNPFAPY